MSFYNHKSFTSYSKQAFPIPFSPLVQCITNEITCESMANALLYINAKPFMADDSREFPEFFSQNNSLLLNLGYISKNREESLVEAARFAQNTGTPFVVDIVGAAASQRRKDLSHRLSSYQPAVIKGNISEMRAYCELKSNARGVDASEEEQSEEAVLALSQVLKQEAIKHSETVYLATGKYDLIVSKGQSFVLENGVPELERFTGTGDIVGSLIAALLGVNQTPLTATINAVSYFNICGEIARKKTEGLADFRQETLNQLSLLMNQADWYHMIRGGSL